MPYRSKAQRRFMFAAEARGDVAKGTAAKWEAETPKGKLPEHVKKAAKKVRLQKQSEMQKWTSFVDELGNISEGGEGDEESATGTQLTNGAAT